MSYFSQFFCAGLLVAGLAVPQYAQAATINVTRLASNPHETIGMHTHTAVDGWELAGAEFLATYDDGSTEEIVWEDIGPWTINGFADGEGLDGFMSWDGIELTAHLLLSSLRINLAPANAVFDTTYIFDPDPASTPGSSFGQAFTTYLGNDSLEGEIDVAYSGIVNLTGAPAAGDLYTTMLLDFTGLAGGGLLGELGFWSDMDSVSAQGELTPTSVVPLPAGLPLMLAGLGILGLTARRNKCTA